MNKRPLESYMQPVHDDDCDMRRDEGRSSGTRRVLARARGSARCTCGLDEARRRIKKHEVDIQCQQHFGSTSVCRLVQLRHRVGISNAWQEPRWVCANCRDLLPGQFRYCDDDQFYLNLARAEGVVM